MSYKAVILILAVVFFSFSGYGCRGEKGRGLRVSALNFFTEKDFNRFFPRHDPFYSYAAFRTAVREMSDLHVQIERRGNWIFKITRSNLTTGNSQIVRQDEDWDQDWARKQEYTSIDLDYGGFCASKSQALNKKEAAAFFAQLAHETRAGADGSFDDGLMLKTERDTSAAYVIPNAVYPAFPGKRYYGRGPMQLSYNGNYGFASTCILGDKNVLLQAPELVSTDAVLAFKTALYFWMTPQGKKPSAHAAFTGSWKPSPAEYKSGYRPGFGMTTNIINGALECNKGEGQQAMQDRIGFYQHFLGLFGQQDEHCACSCAVMPAIL